MSIEDDKPEEIVEVEPSTEQGKEIREGKLNNTLQLTDLADWNTLKVHLNGLQRQMTLLYQRLGKIDVNVEDLKTLQVSSQFAPVTIQTLATDSVETQSTSTQPDYGPPSRGEIKVDWNDLEYEAGGRFIKPRGFLGDKWSNYNMTLTGEGYTWDKKEKHWKFQPGDTKQEESQPQTQEATGVTAIVDLVEGMKGVILTGQMLDDPIQKDIDGKGGKTYTVANFRLSDGSGEARISLWSKLAEQVMDYAAGATISITDMEVKEPFDGMTSVSSGWGAKLYEGELLDEVLDQTPWVPEREELDALIEGWKENKYGCWTFSSNYPRIKKAILATPKKELNYGDRRLSVGGDDYAFMNHGWNQMGNPMGQPSEGQLKLMKSNKIPIKEKLTKIEASIAIAAYYLDRERAKYQ